MRIGQLQGALLSVAGLGTLTIAWLPMLATGLPELFSSRRH